MDNKNYSNIYDLSQSDIKNDDLRLYMSNIYKHIAFALVITGITAMLAFMPPFVDLFYQIQGDQIIGYTGLGQLMQFAPLIMMLYFHFSQGSMSASKARLFLWGFSGVLGISLSNILLVYTGESIFRAFFITASAFGVMSIYGYSTKRDLTSMGSMMYMLLIGLIVASVINIFLGSPMMYFLTTLLGIVVFMGLIAWETQTFKKLYLLHRDKIDVDKIAIIAALNLYLSVINLFMYLLRLTGDRRR